MNVHDTKRGIKIVGIILIVYALLVATHEGEFWPFSIYPMFSQAGNPWTRAMVLDVTDVPDDILWNEHALHEIYGPPVSLRLFGVDQIDFANFMSKTENWTPGRRDALRLMFLPGRIGSNRLMAAKVHGELTGRDSVVVRVEPFLLITADSVYINPDVDESYYFAGGN